MKARRQYKAEVLGKMSIDTARNAIQSQRNKLQAQIDDINIQS